MNRCRPLKLLFMTLCLVTGSLSSAHSEPPGHGCTAPGRPVDDQDDVAWQRYLDDVDGYRACISDFADANRQAARVHNQAANAATQDWNGFVKRKLNVPEDYPWPPPDPGRVNGP